MKAALAFLAVMASPASAQLVECTLSAPCPGTVCVGENVAVRFEIDRSQFAPPIDPKEPPRNKVTHVRMGGFGFAAEPILMGDVLGFWEDAEALGNRMLIVQPDGTARYSEQPSGKDMTGTCEVSN